jgi:hypothetical protein
LTRRNFYQDDFFDEYDFFQPMVVAAPRGNLAPLTVGHDLEDGGGSV